VLCYEQLIYADYTQKCIASKECSVSYRAPTNCYFKLSSVGETIAGSFEAKLIHGPLTSELIFVPCVLKNRLSSLTYGIMCVHKRVTYITNEVLTPTHDCVFEDYTFDLDLAKRLADCKMYNQCCSAHPYNFLSSYCIVRRNLIAYSKTRSAVVNCASKKVQQV